MQAAAAYIRVSTEEQTEYSPDAQLKAIKDYAKKNDMFLDPKHIYVDEGKSGRKAEKRPAFMQMIGVAKSKPTPFDIILVHKFDRFARNREDSVVYKSLLNKECSVKVISITESIENDKISLIMESMLEAMAEYYSINLAEEVKKGMTEKARRGEPLSIPPFGYSMENKKLNINHDEAKIVKIIFNDFIEGTPYLAIAKKINAMGVLTHRGNFFENRTVEYILRNPVYMGMIRWNPKERTRRNYNHPDIMIVPGEHEPIVDEITFNKAQERVCKIKKIYQPYYKPQHKDSHWLVGLLKCSSCGGSLANSNGYFVCNNYVRGQCLTRNSIRVRIMEALIIQELIRGVKTGNINIYQQDKEKNTAELDALEQGIRKCEQRLERATLAFQDGIDTLEEYKTNKNRIQNELSELTKKQNRKTVKIKGTPQLASDIKEVISVLQSDADSKEKANAARSIIKTIVFDKDKKALQIQYFGTI